MKVEFPATPGKSVSGSLALGNGSSAKVRIRVEILDFYVDETTTPQFVANVPAEAAFSCRSWLSANPMELEVPAGAQVPIRYTVRIPVDARQSSYHCALGFRTTPQAEEVSGPSMRTAVRLITVFYPTVGKPPVMGVIKDLKLEHAGATGADWKVVLLMENSGLMLFRPAGEVTVVDASGNVVEAQKMFSFPSLPQRQQRYVLPLKTKLSPGSYTLRARIEVGGEIQDASVAVNAETLPAPGPPPIPK